MGDKDNSHQFIRDMEKALKTAMEDIVNDLARTASEATPHDKGILEQSYEKEVIQKGNDFEGTVTFKIRESSSGGNFNYAGYMHEGNYKLGNKSLRKGGATGMSGKTYRVGNKFLTRVLEGERATYTEHYDDAVKKVTKKYSGR